MNIPLVRFAGSVPRLARMALTGAALSGVAALGAQSSTAAETTPPTAAVWQPYEVNFHYFATGTYYSCSGLEDRLEGMLQTMGASKDVHVGVSGCFGPATGC